jgi:hypothetical protein
MIRCLSGEPSGPGHLLNFDLVASHGIPHRLNPSFASLCRLTSSVRRAVLETTGSSCVAVISRAVLSDSKRLPRYWVAPEASFSDDDCVVATRRLSTRPTVRHCNVSRQLLLALGLPNRLLSRIEKWPQPTLVAKRSLLRSGHEQRCASRRPASTSATN